MSAVLVAGALTGAMMGMASQVYWLIVFAYRPPALITREGPRSSLGSIVLLAGLFAVMGWIAVGAVIAVVFELSRPDGADSVPFPSPGFTLLVLFLATFALIPAAVMLRSWLRHVLVTYLLFIGLFGLLLPNLVVAVRD
jgi:hypothetical protein